MKNKMEKEKKTLKDYGYHFTAEGKMVDDDGKPFEYTVYETKAENQKRYEAIGDLVTECVYELLEKERSLERVYLPKDSEEEDRSFVYQSKDINTAKRLCVFLNGAGVVRAGQWTRKLIMNESTEEGTMLPYIEKVQSLGYSVLCMNTNQKGPKSTSSYKHAFLAWKEVVTSSAAEEIVVIAHSMGGADTMELARKFKDDFLQKVIGVFLTDSAHGHISEDPELVDHLKKVAKNYVASDLPLGTPIERKKYFSSDSIPELSSGHTDHIWTSHTARECIFKDLDGL